MSELLPCPFCGGKPYFERMGTGRVSCIIECGYCGCQLETGEEGDRCGQQWNRRASPVQAEPVGETQCMPGTKGFTMAAFEADKVPTGTKLYAHPPSWKDAEDAERYRFIKDLSPSGLLLWHNRGCLDSDIDAAMTAEGRKG